MQDKQKTLEQQIGQLTDQLQAMSRELERLSKKDESSAPSSADQPPPSAKTADTGDDDASVSEELISWAQKASLLPRLSSLCFLLVIALVLRTVTDNGMINLQTGSFMGMGYAAALMAAGAILYARKSPLAPVFAVCGALLICSIVVETHVRFASLPTAPAYLVLMATGAAMGVISLIYNTPVPVIAGTFGMCLAGAAIDYPNPFYPYLTALLLFSNLLGFFAAGLRRCSWLRWILLLVTLFMLIMWGTKLGFTLGAREVPAPGLAAAWFFPGVAVFAAMFLVLAVAGIIRSGTTRISRFDVALPTVNVAWSFAVAWYVTISGGGSPASLGIVGLLVAGLHIGTAFFLSRRPITGAPGTNSLAFAGAVLLALCLPLATGNLFVTVPILSAFGFGTVLISARWQSGGVRLTSYLVQIYACLALTHLMQKGNSAVPAVGILSAALLAGISFAHYRWARNNRPPMDSIIFSRFDKSDRSAVTLLLVALVSGFLMLRAGIYQLFFAGSGNVQDAYLCSQTILINSAAAGLMLLAYARNNREFRNAAILITLIGAGKVFLHDLLHAHGLPLVLSVLSFGIAAALESVLLGKWPGTERQGTTADVSGDQTVDT